MSRPIRYHPLFEADVMGAAAWYNARNPVIASAFIAEVSRAIDQLIREPERRSLVDLGFRYWPVSRFPFVVLYDLYGQDLFVLGVMHTAQESQKWVAERL
jgi:toxin ParE1/3/4